MMTEVQPGLPRVLLVDDNTTVRETLTLLLAQHFHITSASNVSEALQLIATEHFDVLLSDLHMPGPGDGLTVVSAMRHTNPDAITLVFSGYPAMQNAAEAILLQADEVLVKPMRIPELVAMILAKLESREKGTAQKSSGNERVATILTRDSAITIKHWLERVDKEQILTAVPLTAKERTGHLPKLLAALVARLVNPKELGNKAISEPAVLHGQMRQLQGYSIPMLVGESRILQVTIFETLQRNLSTVDFSLLLLDVMAIADEVDSQLEQTIASFMLAEGPQPALALH